jgi:peptidoglycan-associated lipoprotein
MRTGEPLVDRCLAATIASLVVAGVLFAGCAKRPSVAAISAPAPTLPAATAATPTGSSTFGSETAAKSEAAATSGAATAPAPSAAGTEAKTEAAPGPQAAVTPTAPAPAAAAPEASPAAPASQTTTAAVATGAERPPTKEFTVSQELKDINFDFDRYDIRPDDAKILDAHATWLKSNDVLLLIEGHCDERGTNEYNLALGERRARATLNYLVSQGVQADRVTIVSYGEEQPLCTEHAEDCWATNRRAHFRSKPR